LNISGVEKVEKCNNRKMDLGSHFDTHICVDETISLEQGHASA